MSEHVDPDQIETIVGAARDEVRHLGRVDTHGHGGEHHAMQATVYILHSEQCRGLYEDLRNCPYSRALDRGVHRVPDPDLFDAAVVLGIDEYGHLRVVERA